jgi:hypothetical protein
MAEAAVVGLCPGIVGCPVRWTYICTDRRFAGRDRSLCDNPKGFVVEASKALNRRDEVEIRGVQLRH